MGDYEVDNYEEWHDICTTCDGTGIMPEEVKFENTIRKWMKRFLYLIVIVIILKVII